MPRLTFPTFRDRRNKLATTDHHAPSNFTMLSPREQWDLHDYYRYAESLTDDELCAHWRTMQSGNSSLPQRAGRAYKAFLPFLVDEPPQSRPPSKGPAEWKSVKPKDRTIAVRGLVRPRVDIDKLAKVLIEIAKEG